MVDENGERCVMLFGVNIAAKPCKVDDTMNKDIDENENKPSSDKEDDDDDLDDNVDDDDESDNENIDRNDNTDSGQSSNRENKKKVKPWTKKEHQAFLLGLQKFGKGKWKDISKEYVKTKTSTQVASHAQKYFLRKSTADKTKRQSVFDMMLDYEDSKPPAPAPSPSLTLSPNDDSL